MIRYKTRIDNPRGDTEDFDNKLNQAIHNISRKAPEDWNMILDYLQTMAYPVEIDPAHVEMVCAEYHRKQYIIKIIRRLDGLDKV